MADNRATAMRFFMGKGLTRAQAAGVVGSLMQESGLDPTAKNKSSGATGIGQWLGGRLTNLRSSGAGSNLGGQLNFLWSELQGPEKSALAALKKASTVADAASAFTWGFERPGKAEANMANRISQGKAALKLSGGADVSDSDPTASSSTTTTTVQTDPSASVVAALDALPTPEKKQREIAGIQTPAYAAKAVTAGQPIQTQAPEKKPSALDALKTLEIREPQMTTTTTETTSDGGGGGGGGGGTTKTHGFPTAERGKIIGTPGAGTHTLGNWQSDNAVDIAVPEGTPMVALQDGVVVKVRHHPQDGGRFAGDQITIRGANGNEYFYAHGIAGVKPGQRIKKGQTLGETGSANGVAHLHFGQMKGDPRQHTGG